MKRINVAVVGATGAVGEAMIEILDQRKFPVGGSASAGQRTLGRQDGSVR